MKVKSESEVTQSCLTYHNPMDCSLPGPSIHGIFQARLPEWGAIAFSEPSSEFLAIIIMPPRPMVLMQDGAPALQKAPAHLEASPRCSPTRHLPPNLTAWHCLTREQNNCDIIAITTTIQMAIDIEFIRERKGISQAHFKKLFQKLPLRSLPGLISLVCPPASSTRLWASEWSEPAKLHQHSFLTSISTAISERNTILIHL